MKKVITLIGEHEDGDLFFEIDDPETPQRLFNFLVDNIEEDETHQYRLEMVDENLLKDED